MASRSTNDVVAVLGDLAGSRRLSPSSRSTLQIELDALMRHINQKYRNALLARFLVTLGDEFQGLLKTPSVAPDIVQDISERLQRTPIRIAISRGKLSTPLKRIALGTDGPAWYLARDLLTDMRKSQRFGPGFVGFGSETDQILNALAGLLTHQWQRFRASQREIVAVLRQEQKARKDVASKLGITRQALSNRARSAGFREYMAGLDAMALLLRKTNSARRKIK